MSENRPRRLPKSFALQVMALVKLYEKLVDRSDADACVDALIRAAKCSVRSDDPYLPFINEVRSDLPFSQFSFCEELDVYLLFQRTFFLDETDLPIDDTLPLIL